MIGFIVMILLLGVFLSSVLAICMVPDEAPGWLYKGVVRPWVWGIAIFSFLVLTILGPHVIWPVNSQEPNKSPSPSPAKKT